MTIVLFFQHISQKPGRQDSKTVWPEKHFAPAKWTGNATAAMKSILPIMDLAVQATFKQVFPNLP